MTRSAYCTAAVFALAALPATAQPPAPVSPGVATFNVFFQSSPIGFEQVELARDSDGWIIRSRGDLSQPIDLQNQLFEVRYDEAWRPRELRITGFRGSAPFSLITTFDAGGAANEIEEAGQARTHVDPVEPDAVVLPNYFFAGFEALAVRVAGAGPGDEIPVYVAPQGSVRARVDQVFPQEIQAGAEVIQATVHRVSLQYADRPLAIEVWTDAAGRLLRVTVPDAAIDVAREDLSSAGARARRTHHPGDEDVRVRAEGFALAVTVTTPPDRPAPEAGWPAVLLVPGAGAGDRDGTVSGVPVLGRLAGALADAGFLVARYDRRGVGQSGGRAESAGFEAYGDDGQRMVRYLDDREDVDDERIAVLGYAEGGWAAMVTAERERRTDDLILVGSPGSTGEAWVLEQQRAELDRIGSTPGERRARIALQQRIHAAVLGEGSWAEVPEAVRRQADTASFRSLLEFDTEEVLGDVRQPVLVLRGSLDERVPPEHADRLLAVARARDRDVSSDLVVLEGLDHLLVERGGGDASTYQDLRQAAISGQLVDRLVTWLERPR